MGLVGTLFSINSLHGALEQGSETLGWAPLETAARRQRDARCKPRPLSANSTSANICRLFSQGA